MEHLFILLARLIDHQMLRSVQYLKAENEIYRARFGKAIHTRPHERRKLLKFGKPLGSDLKKLIKIVTYSTFLRWIREEQWGSDKAPPRKKGRRRTKAEIEALVVQIARAMGATVVSSARSRGLQLNAGAAQARGDILLFLHTDTLLPPDYAATIRQTVRHPQVAAGAFRFAIDAPGAAHRLVEWGVGIRSTLFERPYGDQAFFMTRDTFHAIGGFPPLQYMEDYAMLPRLKKHGRILTASRKILTSPRSWQEQGSLRTTLQHQWTILCYHLGRCPTEPRPARAHNGQPPSP